MSTEATHCAVVHTGTDFERLCVVLVSDLVERERAEHDLTLEAEDVECVGPLGRIERTEAGPRTTADVEHARFELGHQLGVGVPTIEVLTAPLNGLQRDRQLGLCLHRPDEGDFLIGRDSAKEVVEFEEVAVDVDDPSVSCIRHAGSSLFGWRKRTSLYVWCRRGDLNAPSHHWITTHEPHLTHR